MYNYVDHMDVDRMDVNEIDGDRPAYQDLLRDVRIEPEQQEDVTMEVDNHEDDSMVKRVLVVCPSGSILNWFDKFKLSLPKEPGFKVYQMAGVKHNSKDHKNDIRLPMLKTWHDDGGVMIIGSDMLGNLTNPKYKKIEYR
ncbi:hypothetical protein DAPPUDRAFT_115242 [Daphnia pulex]|uniref:Uncharacterized protein n=1 Tax=Daphnia pulex TaxID=6669 RepID=E9HKQ2_DAPPU|nr:hypothetical protein DAPPUDRAFT_115242 [Daphnia pulex]|eukprot:EFX67697.1 hypothetical protein DAPPUDRAFT_115242 [Daphnia pulex]